MMACAVTDLPEPDSPRMASVSPSCEVERHAVDRLGDAVAGAELDVQVVDLEQRWVAYGGGDVTGAPSPQLRVEGVADGVAEHDERQHRRRTGRRRGRTACAARPAGTGPRVGDRDAPGDDRRLQADAQEGQRRLGGDVGTEGDAWRPRSPGPSELGRMCRRMIRVLEAPSARAAWT